MLALAVRRQAAELAERRHLVHMRLRLVEVVAVTARMALAAPPELMPGLLVARQPMAVVATQIITQAKEGQALWELAGLQ